MKWLIYGRILEKHVIDSLIDSLTRLGDEIFFLENIRYKNTNNPPAFVYEKTFSNIKLQVEKKSFDAFFAFRPYDLTYEHLNYLKKSGIVTFAWLADDPLLYNYSYKNIVQYFDFILTCGYSDVLQFYQAKHKVYPITFPFWTSNDYFPYSYNINSSDIDIGFLGNCHTTNRQGRYDFIASLPFKTCVYGKLLHHDYSGIWGGEILNFSDIPLYTQRFKFGLNIPQYFSDAKDTEYWFDDLKDFESFYIPSRIIQYAASGIPILTPNTRHIESVSDYLIVYGDKRELIEKVAYLLDHQEKLIEISNNVYHEFLSRFHADNRAQYLHALVNFFRSGKSHNSLDLDERLQRWKEFPIAIKREILPHGYIHQLPDVISRIAQDIPSAEKQVELLIQSKYRHTDTPVLMFVDRSSSDSFFCEQICIELDSMGFSSVMVPIDITNLINCIAHIHNKIKDYHPYCVFFPCKHLFMEHQVPQSIFPANVPVIGYWYDNTCSLGLITSTDLYQQSSLFQVIITNQAGVNLKHDNIRYIATPLSLLSIKNLIQFNTFSKGMDFIVTSKPHNLEQQQLVEKLHLFFPVTEKIQNSPHEYNYADIELIFHENAVNEPLIQRISSSIMRGAIPIIPFVSTLSEYFHPGIEMITFNTQSDLFSSLYAIRENSALKELLKRKAFSRVIHNYTINSVLKRMFAGENII